MRCQVTPTIESGEFQLVISGSFERTTCSPLGFLSVTTNEPFIGDFRTIVVFVPIVSSILKDPVHGLLVVIEFSLLVI